MFCFILSYLFLLSCRGWGALCGYRPTSLRLHGTDKPPVLAGQAIEYILLERGNYATMPCPADIYGTLLFHEDVWKQSTDTSWLKQNDPIWKPVCVLAVGNVSDHFHSEVYFNVAQ